MDSSAAIDIDELVEADAIWCVPASPYADPPAAIEAIRVARENEIPFLGTCGGCQHAALEYARNVLGHADAASSEEVPDASMPLIAALSCRLASEALPINLEAGTRIAAIYGQSRIEEIYNCGYGVNRRYLPLYASGDLRFSAFDDDGDPRALEIASHRFFIGTAFQPERSALAEAEHPLITAFLETAA